MGFFFLLLQLRKGPCSRSPSAKGTLLSLPPCRTPPWALIPFVGEIIHWGAFNWGINITYRDTTLPKSLSSWIWVQLCYINSPTSLLLLHVRLPLTRVYPTRIYTKKLGKIKYGPSPGPVAYIPYSPTNQHSCPSYPIMLDSLLFMFVNHAIKEGYIM